MSGTYNAGYPLWLDGASYAAAALRQVDGGTSVHDTGTTSAVAPASGVYPFQPSGNGALKVAPGTGLHVTVNAGYCAVPNVSSQGVYRFGVMAVATLDVAANATGSTRQDYVVANVQDLNTTGSFAQVQYITGTVSPPALPSNSLLLAQVAVANGAASLIAGNITDKRTWVVPPGCILPVASAGSAPTSPAGQLMYSLATGGLVAAKTNGGTVGGYQMGAAQHWYLYTATTGTVSSLSLGITADGLSDYRIVVQAADTSASGFGKSAVGGQLQILADGVQLDAINALTADGSIYSHVNAGWTYYTSGAQGTTLSAGSHTITFTANFTNLVGPAFIRVDQVLT